MTALRTAPLFACALALAAPAPAQDELPDVRWEPYRGRALDGGALEGRLGRIRVPERRGVEGGATIEIAFVVYPSTSPEPGPPIVYLAGGPGAPGVELAAREATDPRLALLEQGDVIGIDQRGTGLSLPNLSEGPELGWELPLDRPLTREAASAAFADAAQRCFAHWRERGVDPTAYDSAASADDVDAVRRALGLDEIVLWGTSYGAHLGLAYLRRHPEHAARAVLMKVEGPDQTWKLPSQVQAQLERAAALVAADPTVGEQVPDLVGSVRALLARLEEQPLTVTSERFGEPLSVVLGPFDLQLVLSNVLGATQTLAGLPAAVWLMEQGEWSHLLRFVAGGRRGGVDSAMALAMDCASGASAARRARLARELADPRNLLGDAIHSPFTLEVCRACEVPELPDDFRAPPHCDVPVLFVSGELDARTPPANVEELLGGFPEAAHVVATNTGHDDRERESEAFCALVKAFLAGEAVESATIELPPIAFRPIPGR